MPWPVFTEEEAGKLNYAALFLQGGGGAAGGTPPWHVELH